MRLQVMGRVVSRGIAHLLAFLYGLVGPVRLTPGERLFIEANRALWMEMAYETGGEGELLVEPIAHPIVVHANGSFAVIAGRARKLRPLFTLQSHADRKAKAILSSYPGARFTYIHSPRNVPAWIGAWIRAINVYRRLREPRDILSLTTDGHRYGDIIYDALLARGYATVSAVDFWTLITLQRCFFYESVIARIVREHDVRSYVGSHSYMGFLQGIFARALMRRRIEVLSRIGSRELMLRKYRGPEEIGQYPLRPEPSVLTALLEDPTGEARRNADRYIEQRIAQATDNPSANLAFDRSRRRYLDRTEFCADHGLDPAKPIVFVMLHAFNDYPHSHFRRPFMFQDYYDWFIKTLERARSITSVNWVIKEHPGANYYPTRDVDVGRIMEKVGERHVTFLPYNADFNAASIRDIGHAIVTCVGTAGLEYACFGIPCLVAGEGPYVGYGFTREPTDRNAYLRELEGLADLGRLSEEQVRVARLVAWYELGLVYDLPYALGTEFEYWQMVEFRKFDIWKDIASILRTADRAALRRQMDVIAEFLATEGAVQLLNLERYPFLRAASGMR